ncbi:MAG: cyclic nucleotide-binding domain-containing protein, partial [Bosea sp. (in: a-proteobacteria)]|nr:cyclic nucleotide-binding domain-containing protein [Bosea sp. (in: a-proteobacteria)]
RACGDIRTVSAGTDLLRQDAPTSGLLHILLDGWAARYKIMEEGSRFIPALAVPGDICDLDALRFDQLDYGVTMLSAGKVAVLPRQRADALFVNRRRTGTPDRRLKGTPSWHWRASMLGAPFALLAA